MTATCITCGDIVPCLCEDAPDYDTTAYWTRVGEDLAKNEILPPRVARIDGSLHFERDCCRERKCPRCGAVEHFQGIYGGYVTICEHCPADAEEWMPAGTYCPMCQRTVENCLLFHCQGDW